MKSGFISLLALVLGVGLFGCSTITPAIKTVVLNYPNDYSPVAEGIVVTDLGKRFSIRESADTWPALIQKARPMFAWNGCDLMWIETNQQGRLQFTLDEAYVYQPTNQPRQWVLFDCQTNLPCGAFYSCWNLQAMAALRDSIPPIQNDAGERGSYAVMLDTDPHRGSVFEIGWQREMCAGTAHPAYGRRIYLFKDHSSNWHFLGEGPEEGQEGGEGNTMQSQVEWIETATNGLPLQIKFHVETFISPENYLADDTNRPPDELKINDYALAGPFPAKLNKLK